MYNAENYQQALNLFQSLDDDRSRLFTGKSFLALTDFSSAMNHLQIASESEQQNIRNEALYSLAMAQFELENYDEAQPVLSTLTMAW